MAKFKELPISPVALTDLVRRVEREKSVKVYRLDLAEPLFSPPDEAISETVNAVKSGYYRYTPPRGLPELVEAIQRYFKRTRGLEYSPEEIIVTPGAKFAVYTFFASVLEEGSEVVLITPFWVSFKAIPMMMGGKVVEVPMQRPQWRIEEEALKQAVSKKCRAIVINTPHNPTGAVHGLEELKLIRDLAVDYNLYVLSDEVDWAYVYDEYKHISPATLDGLKERTLVVDSFSKVFCMTGWRVGFAAGPKDLIDDMLVVQQHSVSSPAAFAQKACIPVLEKAEEYAAKIVELCKWNRDYFYEKLSRIDGVECVKPPGAFYFFPRVAKAEELRDGLAEKLIWEAHVAVAPGSLFGEQFKDHFRACYALPKNYLQEAVDRLVELLSRL